MHAPTSVRRTPALSWPPPIRWSASMPSTLTPSAAERPELGAIREHMLIDGQPVRSGQGESIAVHDPATGDHRARAGRRRRRDRPGGALGAARVRIRLLARYAAGRARAPAAGAGRSGRAPRRRAGAPGNAEQRQAAGRGPGAGGRFGRAMAALHGRLGHQDHGRDAVAVHPLPPGTQYSAYTLPQAVGVVGAIIPWNFRC